MRWMVFLLIIGALTGCKNDRTFDQKFDETSNQIEQRATNLDAEMNGSEAGDAVEEDQPKASQPD